MKDIVGPWTVKPVDTEINKKLLKLFRGERDGFIQVGPEKYFFPSKYGTDGPRYHGFQPRSSDVWIVTYPRSGTTLTQELVWVLGNNFDFEAAARVPLHERFPFFEFSSCVHPQVKQECLQYIAGDQEKMAALEKATRDFSGTLEKVQERRFIKTHFPISLLPPQLTACGAKVLYVARHPKDVAVSYYHLARLFRTMDFTGTFEEFWDLFESDQIMWCSYWKHINEGWQQRNNPNVLFLFYEDMIKDMPSTIRQIANFLETSPTDKQVQALTDHLDISNFRNNASVNFEGLRELGVLNGHGQKFIRKGAGKGEQGEYTTELNERANAWVESNLQKTTLRFPSKIQPSSFQPM